MLIALTVVHIVACVFLVLVVLLQTGKGADMGAAFGGASSTVFGAAGPSTLLTRLTTAMAVTFMVTSLALGLATRSSRTSTLFSDEPVAAPVAPAPAAGGALPAEAEGVAPPSEEGAKPVLPEGAAPVEE